MTDDENRKQCPFCGKSKSLYKDHHEGTIIHPAYRIKCDNCGASSGWTDKGDHEEAWNNRASTVADDVYGDIYEIKRWIDDKNPPSATEALTTTSGSGLIQQVRYAVFRHMSRKDKDVSTFKPMATAPKGGGSRYTSDPEWVDPPKILLLFESGSISVGVWDWYYAEGGCGYTDGIAWIEPCSGELLIDHYGNPTGWLPLINADNE